MKCFFQVVVCVAKEFGLSELQWCLVNTSVVKWLVRRASNTETPVRILAGEPMEESITDYLSLLDLVYFYSSAFIRSCISRNSSYKILFRYKLVYYKTYITLGLFYT